MKTEIAVLGIDLGKNSCSLAGLDGTGAVIKRWRMRPETVVTFTKELPPCVIAMEACWARVRGHEADLAVCGLGKWLN